MSPPKVEATEQAPTYGGVLTKPAAQVVATIVGLATVAWLGWHARDVIEAANAAPIETSVAAQIQADVASIKADTASTKADVASTKTDVGRMKDDMVKVKCRLNIDGMCPDQIPVRNSGIGR